MLAHPYHPANRRGLVTRVTTTSDSVFLEHRDRGPCQYREGGMMCGAKERQRVHHPPYHHRFVTKTRLVDAPKGVGKDTPIY